MSDFLEQSDGNIAQNHFFFVNAANLFEACNFPASVTKSRRIAAVTRVTTPIFTSARSFNFNRNIVPSSNHARHFSKIFF